MPIYYGPALVQPTQIADAESSCGAAWAKSVLRENPMSTKERADWGSGAGNSNAWRPPCPWAPCNSFFNVRLV